MLKNVDWSQACTGQFGHEFGCVDLAELGLKKQEQKPEIS
jgi:hypothetical protein